MQDGEYPCLRESEGNTVKSSTNDQTGEHIFTKACCLEHTLATARAQRYQRLLLMPIEHALQSTYIYQQLCCCAAVELVSSCFTSELPVSYCCTKEIILNCASPTKRTEVGRGREKKRETLTAAD